MREVPGMAGFLQRWAVFRRIGAIKYAIDFHFPEIPCIGREKGKVSVPRVGNAMLRRIVQ